MNTFQWTVVALAALSAAALGGGAVRWWCGRRMFELLARLDKLEKARQVAGQHAAQARRQIEQLQKDLAAQHKARAEARSARKRELDESLDAAGDSPTRIEGIATEGEADTGRPVLPAHGFADTQPMI